MNNDFIKKYEIVESVFENSSSLNLNELLQVSNMLGVKYEITITYEELLTIVAGLYDSFDIDKEVLETGEIRFKKSVMANFYEKNVSTR